MHAGSAGRSRREISSDEPPPSASDTGTETHAGQHYAKFLAAVGQLWHVFGPWHWLGVFEHVFGTRLLTTRTRTRKHKPYALCNWVFASCHLKGLAQFFTRKTCYTNYGWWISFSAKLTNDQKNRSVSFRINYAAWSHYCTPMTTDAVWSIPGWVLTFSCIFLCHVPIPVPSSRCFCYWYNVPKTVNGK